MGVQKPLALLQVRALRSCPVPSQLALSCRQSPIHSSQGPGKHRLWWPRASSSATGSSHSASLDHHASGKEATGVVPGDEPTEGPGTALRAGSLLWLLPRRFLGTPGGEAALLDHHLFHIPMPAQGDRRLLSAHVPVGHQPHTLCVHSGTGCVQGASLAHTPGSTPRQPWLLWSERHWHRRAGTG